MSETTNTGTRDNGSTDTDEQLQRKIDDAKVEGWKVDRQEGDRVIMTRNDYGSLGSHFVVALLTVWWTLGLGNLAYAGYRWFAKKDRKVIRAE